MDIALLIPVIRQILQIAGGFLIAHGWLDDAGLDAFIGFFVNAVVFGWWLIDRHRTNKHNRELKRTVEENSNALVR